MGFIGGFRAFPFSVVRFVEFPDFIWGEIVDAPRFRLLMVTLGQMDISYTDLAQLISFNLFLKSIYFSDRKIIKFD